MLKTDGRYAEQILFGDKDPTATYSLRDHYDRVALLRTPRAASQEVVGPFVTAQHLCIFAWFNFAFASLAETQAYFALELALRRRMNGAKASGLRARISFGIAEGWIRPARLARPDAFVTKESRARFNERPIVDNPQAYIAHVSDQIPRDRTWLAHGNFAAGTDAFMTLDLVAQLLWQIYDAS